MTILAAGVAGLAGGIALRSLFVFGWPPVAFVLLLSGLCAGAAFFTRRPVYAVCAILCACAALGMLRFSFAESPLPTSFTKDLRHRVTYSGIVTNDPDVRDANQRVEIRVTKNEAVTKVLAVAPRYPTVAVGDRVDVSGTLALPEPFEDEGRMFHYDKYLERNGVRFLMNYAFIRVNSSAPWYSLPAALARIKHAFIEGIRTTLPEPYASLAGGIVIGGKSGLGNELKETFTRSGLIHMVVLSGHNVMVVATWVIALFTFLFARVEPLARVRNARNVSIGLGVLALLAFVGIAGFSTTAVRATVMALIALYARASGRTYAAGRALLCAVFLMLLYNPLYLLYDPGFALSVAATAGLIWLSPYLETFFLRLTNTFLREVVITTLAAQLAVLPLLLYFTGNLSLVSIPANLLVMPLIPLAMGFSYLAGFAGILFGALAPIIGIALALPAYLIGVYITAVAQSAAALPAASITLSVFPFWLVLLAYGALGYAAVSSKRFSTTLQLRLAKKAST